MKRFEPILLRERPSVVIVVDDVNSTIACALVASKVTYPRSTHSSSHSRPFIAHVEAGLRSFDRSMPEEINRILTDAISDFLLITEESAAENLLREGIAQEKIHFVGNPMVNTPLKHRQKAEESTILSQLNLKTNAASGKDVCAENSCTSQGTSHTCVKDYGVVTLHRPSNGDDHGTLWEILEALTTKVYPIVKTILGPK